MQIFVNNVLHNQHLQGLQKSICSGSRRSLIYNDFGISVKNPQAKKFYQHVLHQFGHHLGLWQRTKFCHVAQRYQTVLNHIFYSGLGGQTASDRGQKQFILQLASRSTTSPSFSGACNAFFRGLKGTLLAAILEANKKTKLYSIIVALNVFDALIMTSTPFYTAPLS